MIVERERVTAILRGELGSRCPIRRPTSCGFRPVRRGAELAVALEATAW